MKDVKTLRAAVRVMKVRIANLEEEVEDVKLEMRELEISYDR